MEASHNWSRHETNESRHFERNEDKNFRDNDKHFNHSKENCSSNSTKCFHKFDDEDDKNRSSIYPNGNFTLNHTNWIHKNDRNHSNINKSKTSHDELHNRQRHKRMSEPKEIKSNINTKNKLASNDERAAFHSKRHTVNYDRKSIQNRWDWGLIDMGFLSEHSNCFASQKKCKKSKNIFDLWYSDCMCPWIWNQNADNCPYGNELKEPVVKANIIVMKNRDLIPETLNILFDLIENFTDNALVHPIEVTDIDNLIDNYKVQISSLVLKDKLYSLLLNFLEEVTPELKEAIYELIRGIQAMVMSGSECDWFGDPGPAPTPEEICNAHLGKVRQQKLNCIQNPNDEGRNCNQFRNNDVPAIWRNSGKTISKGTYCSATGQWFWQNVASCSETSRKCHSCQK